jgi:bifunctional non-homologous end joining protein LigD
VVSVEGRRVRVSNLDKVMYPETGTTKADVLRYYARIAPFLVPHAANRPATRKRWVHGVGTHDDPGIVFFQKDLDASTPDWVNRRAIEHSKGAKEYPLVDDAATLIWLAQMAALEVHVPQWQFARTGGPRNPDRLVLDLDPGEGAGLLECAEVARLTRRILTDMDLDPLPVTSGSKGIHLYCALDGRWTSDQVSAFAHELARALEADHRDLIVSDMKKTLRPGKILIDWSQNSAAKTTIAPYSLRGRSHPMVAAPRTWEELESDSLTHLDFEAVLNRVQEHGDLLHPLLAARHAGLEPTKEHMATFDATPDSRDRLAKYRSMRDQAKTPEPVPEAAAAPTSGTSFVIQEHHARRLHYDFRLEHEGVLVSWALPKGPPMAGTDNHLAVQTEDHPLEYGTFEGTIPQGEYGAGVVTIWDSGEYETEKWRDGKEVIATLTGRPDGGLGGVPRKYALIHTGRDGAENNWLIHLMDGKHRSRDRYRSGPQSDGAESTSAEAAPEVEAKAGEPPSKHREVSPVMRNPSELPLLSPMLATNGSPADLDDDHDWAYEMKWDGYRALVHLAGEQVRLVSRNGKDLTASFPELVAPIIAAVDTTSAVLDGEIVALTERGRPDFGLLQNSVAVAKSVAPRNSPVHIILFDLLELEGVRITDDIYDVRRAALEKITTEVSRVHVPPHFDGNLDDALASSRQLQLEGVMAKVRDSTYSPGRRSRSWIKLKHQRTQEVVIAGWRAGTGDQRDGIGSLVLGVPGEDGLQYAGRVGTGFSEKDRRVLRSRMEALGQDAASVIGLPPADAARTNWVRPELVGEVTFLEWTSKGSMRHPSWRGLRPDKSPDDVQRE